MESPRRRRDFLKRRQQHLALVGHPLQPTAFSQFYNGIDMTTPEQLRQTVKTLVDSQAQGVLATQHDQQPYTSLMAFAVMPDLRWIVFATYRATQKHTNLLANPRVSLLIDNRTNKSTDYQDTIAISTHGTVSEVKGARHDELLQIYLRKNPELKDFVTSVDCALLQLEVETYYIVSQFQNVVKLQMI